jgi:hypothetical protein
MIFFTITVYGVYEMTSSPLREFLNSVEEKLDQCSEFQHYISQRLQEMGKKREYNRHQIIEFSKTLQAYRKSSDIQLEEPLNRFPAYNIYYSALGDVLPFYDHFRRIQRNRSGVAFDIRDDEDKMSVLEDALNDLIKAFQADKETVDNNDALENSASGAAAGSSRLRL